MKLKPGVKLTDLKPQMVLAAMIVQEAYKTDCTITSGNDSTHTTLSLHYQGNALDFRIKDYLGNKQALITEIKNRLGGDFDVLLEGLGTDNEHVHIEWDPR